MIIQFEGEVCPVDNVLPGNHFDRIAFCLACAVTALLGLGVGAVLSVPVVEQYQNRDRSYVQRIALPNSPAASLQLAVADARDFPPRETTLRDEQGGVPEDSEGLPVQHDAALASDPPQIAVAEKDAEVIELADGRRLLNVEFDLGDREPQTGDIEVAKAIHLNGRAVGVISVSVDRRSQLHLSSQDLSQFLPVELFAQIDTGADYIAFDDLRARGLNISYDPLSDVLRIDS